MSDSTVLVKDDDVPGALRQHLGGLKETAPNSRQIGLMIGIALAVAVGLWVFTWSQQPGYVPLYAGLAAKDGGEVIEALRAAEVPYRVDPASGAITVPEERVHELRLKLAAQGLPQGNTRGGIEMIEGEQGFGVSQFVEGARYQHALETELARTIATLRPVRSARVHLALPKPTAFSRGRAPASASVVLELFPGRSLEPNQIAAVVHMVSSSIPDLQPERVTVVDQTGHLLTNPDPDSEDALNARQFQQVRQLEAAYAERVRRLLEPFTGPGRVSVQVNVDMDFSFVEEARETYNNDPAKLRSEQTSEQGNAAVTPAGVPGAASNTPPGPQAAATGAGSTTSRSATRNYELDRTLTHTRQQPGRVKRVTAAVLVDNLPQQDAKGTVTYRPLTATEQTRLESLVREAVGFVTERGDSISVVNAPFMRATVTQAEAAAPIWEKLDQAPPLVKDSLRLLVGAIAVLALIFGVLRPALRQLVGPKAAVASADPPPSLLGGPGIEGGGLSNLPTTSGEAYEDAFRRARAAVGEDPRRVAQVVKNWVNNNG